MASDPSRSSSPQPKNPLQRDIRSPGTWKYLINYILLGGALLLVILELIESGAWLRLGLPCLFILLALGNLAQLQRSEQLRL